MTTHYCAVCQKPFTPVKNQKTCSAVCGRTLRNRREKKYAKDQATIRRIRRRQASERGVIVRYRPTLFERYVDRAVRLLFAQP